MTTGVPLPEPAMRLHGKRGKEISPEAMDWFAAGQLREYAAAVSAADNKALREDNTRLQNEVVAPLRERVRKLEGALIEATRWSIKGSQVELIARAALKEKL